MNVFTFSLDCQLYLVSNHRHVTHFLPDCIPLSPLDIVIRTDDLRAELLGSRRPFRSHLSCRNCSEQVGGGPQEMYKGGK